MTDAELNAIRRRCDLATDPPWVCGENADWRILQSIEADIDGHEIFVRVGCFDDMADQVFCARAREDIPKLLAEIERLRRREIEELDS